jgi:hypothetical protein
VLLLFACTASPVDSSVQETGSVDTGPENEWPSPHNVMLLDVGGRLEWDDGWSLRPGASTGVLYTETQPLAVSEHCRLSTRDDALTAGVSPIRLSTSIERIAGHWDGSSYDMLNFEGQEVFGPEDSLRAYNDEEGLDATLPAPEPLDHASVLGPDEGLATPILAQAEWVWTGVWGEDQQLSCMVKASTQLVPDDGLAIWGDVQPDYIKFALASAQPVEGFFPEPVWLIAGRGYDLVPP